jgi:hypothetical protein
MKAAIKKGKNMAKEVICGQTAANTRALGKTIKYQVKAPMNGSTAENMRGSG